MAGRYFGLGDTPDAIWAQLLAPSGERQSAMFEQSAVLDGILSRAASLSSMGDFESAVAVLQGGYQHAAAVGRMGELLGVLNTAQARRFQAQQAALLAQQAARQVEMERQAAARQAEFMQQLNAMQYMVPQAQPGGQQYYAEPSPAPPPPPPPRKKKKNVMDSVLQGFITSMTWPFEAARSLF